MYTHLYERFTGPAIDVMVLANREAVRLKHNYVGTEHILLGLVKNNAGVAWQIIHALCGDPRKIRVELKRLVCLGTEEIPPGERPLTPLAKQTLDLARTTAAELKHNYVGTEHLLLSLSSQEQTTAANVLQSFIVTPKRITCAMTQRHTSPELMSTETMPREQLSDLILPTYPPKYELLSEFLPQSTMSLFAQLCELKQPTMPATVLAAAITHYAHAYGLPAVP